MILEAVWAYFQAQIFTSPARPGLFNLYSGEDSLYDRPGAAQLRQGNLRAYLESFCHPPRNLMVGEAPGWKGCRFSGIPFTSEALLTGTGDSTRLPFQGAPTSRRATPLGEASATIFWESLAQHHADFLVWNCIPLHPYQPGQPMSNRTPSLAEVKAYLPLLEGLMGVLQPERVIAIGRKAELALRLMGQRGPCVRHPGHGGKQAFQREIEAYFRLRE